MSQQNNLIMKTPTITAKELISGNTLEIETIDKEDLRIAELGFSEHLGKFTIWFNGKLIHTSKGFDSLLNRIQKLNINFPLEF